MFICKNYNLDNVFEKFKVIEFPISYVSLSTTKEVDLEIDLKTSAYLKTTCEGKLMKFEDAREISASHRAFDLTIIDNSTIQIKFEPKSESISKAKHDKQFDNRFVFDIRIIRVDESICCNNELHSEIGRYFISGKYEYCDFDHVPKEVNFGDVKINNKVTRYVRLWNKSQSIGAKIEYFRITGFEIYPQKFYINPNSSKKISITVKPTCLKIGHAVIFRVRNPHENFDDAKKHLKNENNFISYAVPCKLNVKCPKFTKNSSVESLHKLKEENPLYTYLGEELVLYRNRKQVAYNYMKFCNSTLIKKISNESETKSYKIKCHTGISPETTTFSGQFCDKKGPKMCIYKLLDILIMPFSIDFGKVGISTYGESELIIKNGTTVDIEIELSKQECVLYTDKRMCCVKLKLKSRTEIKIAIFCFGSSEGHYTGYFKYTIDQKYYRKHPYSLQVATPTLAVYDKSLKFGMVTSETFVTSVPVRLYNDFNLNVDFKWSGLHNDTPFEIIPNTGSISKHSFMICDINYICKATKTKSHEVDLLSLSSELNIIPIELNIITRKLSIKFLQPAVIFKDIALNLKTIKTVKLENSSREIALFHVLEPLIPGLIIEPMSGIIRPKMVMTFKIIIEISCVLEFAFDIFVKINNKENVSLPVSGNIVDPKILIHPKNIYMARIPCNMITYVPVTFQNASTLRTIIDVLDTGDDNIFKVFIAQGNEKVRIFQFCVEGGQSKTVYLKIYDIFRREYEMYIPFKINGLLGPPDSNPRSTELQYYIGEYERCYENNSKVKLKTVTKDITYCRITGVITVPWVQFSTDSFEIDYKHSGNNHIEFTMTNVSKYTLHVTILTSKLSPTFSLDLCSEEIDFVANDSHLKFELDCGKQVLLILKFCPKGHGRFVSVALLYLDKHMTIPYHNLTFIGRKQSPVMTSSSYKIIFPPCKVGDKISRSISLKLEAKSSIECFSCVSKEETNLCVRFLESNIVMEQDTYYTIVKVIISVSCQAAYARNITLNFLHENGSGHDVDVSFCFTYCPLSLHTNVFISPADNPYPFFPPNSQSELYNYLETCTKFLEKWMFQQGFRRDLYPVIPDTFHAISSAVSSQQGGAKTKGINVSYLNFVRRIAGPLMKHIRKISVFGVDDAFKYTKEIHDTYREIINLIKSRGADLCALQPKFLLSYEEFVIFSENVTPKCNADILLTKDLIADVNLFERLNKQSWIDFILQSYKVFVMDSCFFDCVCISSQPRDIIKIMIDWYNENIASQHQILRGKDKPIKNISNITTDLSDGIAIISSIMKYCPFLEKHFTLFCETVNSKDKIESCIINNACLIIEAVNYLKLYFPLCSKDFLHPNFLQMLFLSIHLYVTLPMFKPKDIIKFNPPLLRTSTRQIGISPINQESLIYNYLILNNTKNVFTVEKESTGDNGKKMFLNVKYTANFTENEETVLLIHGYNKTRIFDTYIIFLLQGRAGTLAPVRKCKVTGPLYRPNKVDLLVSSPFANTATYQLYITDIEPTVPIYLDYEKKPKFFIRRLNLIDDKITLNGVPKETGQEILEQKMYFQIVCLSAQIGNTWVWFRSEIGEFFIRVTTQPRWDLAIDTLQAKVQTWPMDPCSCGEACECYRTTVLLIPHRNDLMLKSLRFALSEYASDIMLQVYDQLIETTTGKIILQMLFAEGGTNLSELHHILRSETNYRITSRALSPQLDRAKLAQHTEAFLALPVTIPAQVTSEKYSITLTSDCGMDIRTYRIVFISSANDGCYN